MSNIAPRVQAIKCTDIRLSPGMLFSAKILLYYIHAQPKVYINVQPKRKTVCAHVRICCRSGRKYFPDSQITSTPTRRLTRQEEEPEEIMRL